MAGTITAATFASKGRGVVRADNALTCADGAISATTIGSFFGRIVAVAYEPTAGAGSDMDSGTNVTLTDAFTGASILTDADFGTARWERPTKAVVTNAGAAITPAANAANNVNRDIFVAGALKLAIDGATTTDTGLMSIVFEEAS
jgi:hypothetical protein